MGRPVHFEIHAADGPAAVAFYSELFGWAAEQWGDQPYWLLKTGDGSPGIDGAIMERRGPAPAEGAPVMGAVVIMGVEDLDTAWEKGLSLGARPALEKMAVPGMGWAANLRDPDGNVFGLFQHDPEAQ